MPAGICASGRSAAEALVRRVLPHDYGRFRVEMIPAAGSRDVFEIETVGNRIVLRGNNGVSVAGALKYYLNRYAGVTISWHFLSPDIPTGRLPDVPRKIRIASPWQYRYYLNYVTFNYSALWWDWERWEQELDWMALMGINMPLAVLGQNKIWQRVYGRLGIPEEELQSFFSGPAYTGFHWMGLLDGWNGPMPQRWIDSHSRLQRRILQRARELGMTPVLPAFTGHVPEALLKKYPEANVRRVQWTVFPSVALLDPADPLFRKIGKLFIDEQTKAYGTDHYYSADPFIEVVPPSADSAYLGGMSRAVYRSMADADPAAVWVTQGWMFYFKSAFWKKPQVSAYLGGVPDDRLIVLDLWSENKPVWNRFDAYYGKRWLWCMLQNFGGYASLFGKASVVARKPFTDRADPASGHLSGLGLTMEGIEQNPFIYDLMLSNVWRDTPSDLPDWTDRYARIRYGVYNEAAQKAWRILAATVYDYRGELNSGGCKSVVTSAPFVGALPVRTDVRSYYDPAVLLPAWEKLLAAAGALGACPAFRYDLVDVTRQALSNYSNELHQYYTQAFAAGDTACCRRLADAFLELIDDMDRLLATHTSTLLGAWLAAARAWGVTPQEKALYERNARNLLTLWHGKEKKNLQDYSARQWSGLLKGFYRERWKRFFAYAGECLAAGNKPDWPAFDARLRDWEWQWVNASDLYPVCSSGSAVEISKVLYAKYIDAMRQAYAAGAVKADDRKNEPAFHWF